MEEHDGSQIDFQVFLYILATPFISSFMDSFFGFLVFFFFFFSLGIPDDILDINLRTNYVLDFYLSHLTDQPMTVLLKTKL